MIVWPSFGLLIVGALVTLAVNVVVNTFDKAAFKVMVVALKVTTTGVVWAAPPKVESPVNDGLASGAKLVATKAVVAKRVELLPAVCVGAVGLPVRAGEASKAKLVCTNAVVAICVVLVAPEAVGAVGVPVSAGLAKGA